MKYIRLHGILILALLAVTQAGATQEVTWTYRAPTGGWLGITVDFTLTSIDGREQTLTVITDVAKGSPAQDAGIQVGDTITRLDGRSASQQLFSSLPERLKPGDIVRIAVRRQGMSREFLVEARERPPSQIVVGPDAQKMVVELETLSGNILKNLDSLRLSIAGLHLDSAGGDLRLHVLRVPTGPDDEGRVGFQFRMFEPFADTVVMTPGNYFMAPEVAMPFEALIVDSKATAELKEELLQLRRELTTVRRDEISRQRELAATVQGSVEEAVRRDEQIRELRAREQGLLAEQGELTARLRRVSEEEMQRHWMEVQEKSDATLREAYRAQVEAFEGSRAEREDALARARELYTAYSEDRFRSPVLVGQNFMLGAQLAPLTPQLAEYFPVDQGVFVVQVLEDTPASDAGLQGGDIIIRVAGEDVTSLSDLRFGLSSLEGPLQIRVIRKGNPVDILIRR